MLGLELREEELIIFFRMPIFRGESSLRFNRENYNSMMLLETFGLDPRFLPGKIFGGVYSFEKCFLWPSPSANEFHYLCLLLMAFVLLIPKLLNNLLEGTSPVCVLLNQVPLRLLIMSLDLSSGTFFEPTM